MQKQFFTEQEALLEHIDNNQHVNNMVYLRWAHTISHLHWNTVTSPSMQKNTMWVLGRQEIDYKKEVKLGEKITLCTFIHSIEKQKCFRHVVFTNEKKELVATCILTWICLEASTKKPMRVSSEIIDLF
jgi:acyl-CoA thioester hydrolase